MMFVRWSFVVQPNHICSKTPTWPLALFVTSCLASSLWGNQFKHLISYSPAGRPDFLSPVSPVPFFCACLPCVRWLRFIVSNMFHLLEYQTQFEAILYFLLRWIDQQWSPLSTRAFMVTFTQWFWAALVLKSVWYQLSFIVIIELCEYHNCC